HRASPAYSKSCREAQECHSLGEILDAVFYIVVRSGCAWRLLAHEFPPWKTIHHTTSGFGA
ncbi:MAG: transposase, partial [Actinomycetota bacterium]|nr:transposase [Actinomycetota bacterium]